MLSTPGGEVTFLRFYVDKDGKVTKTNKLKYPMTLKGSQGDVP